LALVSLRAPKARSSLGKDEGGEGVGTGDFEGFRPEDAVEDREGDSRREGTGEEHRAQEAAFAMRSDSGRGGRFITSGSMGSVARQSAGRPSVTRLIHSRWIGRSGVGSPG
jgi:hypothetical protein